jgi:hypothetical protein
LTPTTTSFISWNAVESPFVLAYRSTSANYIGTLTIQNHSAFKSSMKMNSMMDLNDASIREALLRKLVRQKSRPRAVLQELHVHNGKAIADVVTLHSEAHCYEIKGATDRIERIAAQGVYYNAAFRRITLVTTECNLRRALRLVPRFWGIMVAIADGIVVRFRHVRAARLNPNFEKQWAAMTLWKSEMLELVEAVGAERKPRRLLAQLIAETRREVELSRIICDLLTSRCFRPQSFASSTM